MLLGAPGSGKSTLVSHLALCLAGAALAEHRAGEPQPEGGWLACLPRWQPGALLPVRVILRDLAAFAPLDSAPHGSLRLLEEFFTATLADAGCAEALDPLTTALREGRGLLLLDGLDEVVGATVLQRVAETIADAARGYRAPILVTCRVLDYQEERLRQLPGFPTATLAELEDEQIQQFIGDWYAELAASGRRPPAQTEADTRALRDAVASRSELRTLAGIPLLLTVMALVHAFRGSLPDARALLYAECVELLLLRWRQPRGESDLIERLALPQFRSSDLLALMARLGYEAHQRAERDETQKGSADLDEPAVMALLAEEFARYDAPRRYQLAAIVLDALTRGNGLLLKRGPQVYTFAHRTFQEFLAGYHLKSERDFRRLCLERAPLPHWHEVLTLMVGYQVLQDRELDKPLSLVEKLIERTPLEQALAGELLVLIGRERADKYDPTLLKLPDGLWPRTRKALLHLLTQGRAPAAPAPLRHRAGLALGLLCYGPLESLEHAAAQLPMPDPRLPFAVLGLPAQGSSGWPKALAHYWCRVEAGPFWSGDDRPKKREPLRRIELRHSYRIARYPVTNADYARFIAAGGYGERQWWTEHGWEWLSLEQKRADRDAGKEYRPSHWRMLRYNNPLQPVVTITWYEAAAYCNWLTGQGHTQGWLPKDELIRLPSWLEWERAARHTDQRPHPWGNLPPDPERANYDATEIGVPSPTGCFPAGAAICGAHDLLGNVWEWTATRYEKPREVRSQLGEDFTRMTGIVVSYSAFGVGLDHIFCGARDRVVPNNGNGGLRVIQSRALIK
jgi:formylglycine-generating enzyme required for sulfatase activity